MGRNSYPRKDAIIMKAKIKGVKTRRLLVDNGNLYDILFSEAS